MTGKEGVRVCVEEEGKSEDTYARADNGCGRSLCGMWIPGEDVKKALAVLWLGCDRWPLSTTEALNATRLERG